MSLSVKETILAIANKCETGHTTKWDADYLRTVAEFVETGEKLCAIQTVLEVEADDTWIAENSEAKGESNG